MRLFKWSFVFFIIQTVSFASISIPYTAILSSAYPGIALEHPLKMAKLSTSFRFQDTLLYNLGYSRNDKRFSIQYGSLLGYKNNRLSLNITLNYGHPNNQGWLLKYIQDKLYAQNKTTEVFYWLQEELKNKLNEKHNRSMFVFAQINLEY